MTRPDALPAEGPGRLWELLGETERQAVRAAAEVRRFAAGAVIIREGDRSNWVLILMAGRVKITAVSAGGYDAVLAVRDPGDIVGEMAAMDGRDRSATVVAVEPVTALWLSSGAFAGVLQEYPAVSAALLRIVAARLRHANARRTEFGDSTAAERIAALLLDLAERYGVAVPDGTLIALRISQRDLAGLASASREAVGRTLRTLRAEGVLSTGRQRLIVRSLPELQRLAVGKAT
ncbi:Crp/Fnr family transcriptional regulator [Amycolatopsis sp. H20-H5]|uniref:Crp/Fnr family transcriptional regulator n=1 Tax=Amycolatopsis sp. H20-H5 TaxID=3046309 RepID=UPI002DBA42A5|nr:Crp/Fnr family transcriptional regulator [Amycolatopsis sp. H20-H5]MEC3976036.1 Crp/Fnr family transcriptional regulator [Amycolatopsis sp. H20-H5]